MQAMANLGLTVPLSRDLWSKCHTDVAIASKLYVETFRLMDATYFHGRSKSIKEADFKALYNFFTKRGKDLCAPKPTKALVHVAPFDLPTSALPKSEASEAVSNSIPETFSLIATELISVHFHGATFMSLKRDKSRFSLILDWTDKVYSLLKDRFAPCAPRFKYHIICVKKEKPYFRAQAKCGGDMCKARFQVIIQEQPKSSDQTFALELLRQGVPIHNMEGSEDVMRRQWNINVRQANLKRKHKPANPNHRNLQACVIEAPLDSEKAKAQQ